MKIACVTTSKIPSTTANSIQVMKACSAMAGLSHEVRVWSPDAENDDWEHIAALYGIKNTIQLTSFKTIPAIKRYDFAWKAAYEAKKWGAEIFYTWLIPAGRFAQIIGLPSILELHDRLMGQLGPYLFKKFMHCDAEKRLVIITKALQKTIQNQTGIGLTPGEVVIAPNGVDLDRFINQPSPSDARKLLGFDDRITAVFSGHLYAGRGIGLLAELAIGLPDVQFIWVGGRPEDITEWRIKLQKRGIRNVILTGFIDNAKLPLYLAAGDVFLMPYEHSISGSSGGNTAEICSPMKLFEYMAVGRAILSSDLPVIREILNDEQAIFIPPEDTDAWLKALNRIIHEPFLRQKLGSVVSTAVSQYSWLQRQAKILDGFNQTL